MVQALEVQPWAMRRTGSRIAGKSACWPPKRLGARSSVRPDAFRSAIVDSGSRRSSSASRARSVSQRTREIGIRIALGAPLQEVTGLFVRHGLVISGIGAICGLTAAFALTRLMKSLLYDVTPADPVTYGAVSAGLILVAALASYLVGGHSTN